MSLKCGIVGLPNVGKSTLFNALTKAGIAAENYPFCTIEPNVGIVEVPDPRLAKLAAIVDPERVLPAAMEFVDIAGARGPTGRPGLQGHAQPLVGQGQGHRPADDAAAGDAHVVSNHPAIVGTGPKIRGSARP